MRSLRRAAARFRDAGSIPFLLVALLLIAAAAPLSAGERSRPSDSSDAGRSAQPRGGGDSGGGHSSPPSSYTPPPSSSGGGSEPRVAVPRSNSGSGGGSDRGEPSRQRPHNPSGGGRDYRGGGGWYGPGYYYGYPRYYYYGPHWGWGWSWWWDDYYWYGRGGYYAQNPWRDRYYDRYGTAGALDIDVSPGKTEVWIDGRYTGTADDFDGFPQYLWLDRGTYDVVLFREGYKTIARQITVRSGQVISLGDRMQPGDSVRPEDLVTKTHDRRDERIRSEEERRAEIERGERGDGMDDWRERARRRMEERNRYEDDDRDDDAGVRGEDGDVIGRLRLDVEPEDASVYVDGRFVGTGIDLQRLRNGLRLEPGEHRIAVVRPGRKAVEQQFTVAAGEEVELEFDLESLE